MKKVKNNRNDISLTIEARGLCKAYNIGGQKVDILQGANFSVNPGQLVVIIGVSGSGKSTLLNLLGGIDNIDSGDLTVCENSMKSMTESELTNFRFQNIGFIFQFYNLLPTLTALENVILGLQAGKTKGLDIKSQALEYLEKVGLAEKANKFPDQMSGGEQQRVAIARALVKKPPLILADEPTGNLDESTGEEIQQLFRAMSKEYGTTLVIVTHNPSFSRFADKILKLHNGKISEELLENISAKTGN